ncbi:MAG: thioredoxin-dependent thiol peroxidase [Bacteroidales bacterium]
MAKLEAGMKVPWFEGPDQDGNIVNLSDFAGRKLILYFYPKDNTPGCTAEACSLRDGHEELLSRGFAVVGISIDSEKSHKSFSKKYSLPFPLIADTTKKISDDYGVWKEKSMYGKSFLGVVRTTFIIDENGVLEEIIEKVETKDHANQIFKLYQ